MHISWYAHILLLAILNHQHEYGCMHDAVELRAAHKRPRMTCLENFYIKISQHKGKVMNGMVANIILYMKWCTILNCNTQAC